MRFLIYGAGALGQAIGCMLATDGHEVDLVLRERFQKILETNGLKVTGIFGDYEVAPGRLNLVTNLNCLDGSPYEYVLITTKAYDTENAVKDITGLHGFQGTVVSMQNGCGNMEQVEAAFGSNRSLGARVITGFEIERPGIVRITVSADEVHVGGCRQGHIPGTAVRFAEAVNKAGLPCCAVDDIHKDLFAKLLYNCALNPLGAILGVHYGALSDSVDCREIMDRVIEETFMVIDAMGFATHWQGAEVYKEIFYGKLVPVTYDHRPSMLQDIEQEKPTEVEALIGYVAAQGKKSGVATPACDILAALVRFKEKQTR